jgi:extradiol dioxygenase family protein
VALLKSKGIKFIIEPTLRFKGMPGEQWTCFFKDPSGPPSSIAPLSLL